MLFGERSPLVLRVAVAPQWFRESGDDRDTLSRDQLSSAAYYIVLLIPRPARCPCPAFLSLATSVSEQSASATALPRYLPHHCC